MKTYPTIPKQVHNVSVYAFDKLDGSNIRAEWSRKRGFYKYGTRKRLLAPDESPLGGAIELINDEYGVELSDRLKEERAESAVCYFEFFGENSFAGFHEEHDNFKVVLFDISIHKRGFLPPREFMDFAWGLETPKLVYQGNANQPFVRAIREGTYHEVTFEGVVCKYVDRKQVKMFKVKSQAWLDRLKFKCGEDSKLFKELS